MYALHEPEVNCISKDKARVRYEFGTKVSIAPTLDGGLVVGTHSIPSNPYDGHALGETLGQVTILTHHPPKGGRDEVPGRRQYAASSAASAGAGEEAVPKPGFPLRDG